jgi:von Willebrand factor type A domain
MFLHHAVVLVHTILRTAGSVRLHATVVGASLSLIAASPLPTVGVPADPPSNVACLPFPEKDVVTFNGGGAAFDDLTDPYVNTADQATVTWKDVDDPDITGYRVERSVNGGAWSTLVDDLPPDTRFSTDTGLDLSNEYDYRVRQKIDQVVQGPSDVCQAPSVVSSPNFQVYYRTEDCPDVDDADASGHPICVANVSSAQYILDSVEGALSAMTGLGFKDPLTSPPLPIDLFPCDGVGCSRSAGATGYIGLNPDSMQPGWDPGTGNGKQASVWTPLHELFHKVQGSYGCCGTDKWVLEGQARSMQDKLCVESQVPCADLDQAPGTNYDSDVNAYLLDPNQNLTELDYPYRAALFWTYLAEQYGAEPGEPEFGVDFIRTFLERTEADGTDGIDTITSLLADIPEANGKDFADVFRDFAAANYAKDLANAPDLYRYVDEGQPPGTYGSVDPDPDFYLLPDTQSVGVIDVAPWGVRYVRAKPSLVETIDMVFDAQLPNALGYRVLAVRDGSIVYENDFVGPDFSTSLINDEYDEVVVVITGLEDGGIVNYAINGKDPEVILVDPLRSRPIQAGDPADPRKILVKAEVLAPEDGSPIAGIDPASEFTMSIGGVALDLTDPNVLIARAYVQGQYWMVVRAPVQTGPGKQTLVLAYGDFDDSEFEAVDYEPLPDSDNILVVDRSGSMGAFDKLASAKDGGRLYVDTWDTGDQIGVVSFADGTATPDLKLVGWDAGTRTDAFTALGGLSAFGTTAIGAGLLEGLNQFDTTGDPDHLWAETLLTDALDNTDPTIADFMTDYDARVAGGTQVPVVNTVGLGPDADLVALEQLAADTGGSFQYASQAPAVGGPLAPGAPLYSEMAEIHRVVVEAATLQDQVYADTTSGILPGGTDQHIIHVEKGATLASFAVNWSPAGLPGLAVSLFDPDGLLVAPTLTDTTHQLFVITKPKTGDWQVLVQTAPNVLGTYLVEAAVRGDVSLFGFLGLAPEDRVAGAPMPIEASLSEGAGIPDATVTATITDPAGADHLLTMHDDGLHGDGAAEDGFYGTTFAGTSIPGSYVVAIDANGTAPVSGSFDRRVRLAFNIQRGPDGDGDGLPDRWEDENGTDPTVPDGTGDPDGDLCKNLTEFQTGTHPFDADTDDGGQNDCSERKAGIDPLDPGDDRTDRPRSRAWPGVGRDTITYTGLERGETALIERADAPEGPWVVVASTQRSEPYVDDGLQNDHLYCYRVSIRLGTSTTSAPSQPDCVTPAVDPYWPIGSVVIANDRPVISKRTTVLTLHAGEQPDTADSADAYFAFVDGEFVPSGVTEMKLWNPGREATATWEPFAERRNWRLVRMGSIATVFVRFRDAAGNESTVFSDSISFVRP